MISEAICLNRFSLKDEEEQQEINREAEMNLNIIYLLVFRNKQILNHCNDQGELIQWSRCHLHVLVIFHFLFALTIINALTTELYKIYIYRSYYFSSPSFIRRVAKFSKYFSMSEHLLFSLRFVACLYSANASSNSFSAALEYGLEPKQIK